MSFETTDRMREFDSVGTHAYTRCSAGQRLVTCSFSSHSSLIVRLSRGCLTIAEMSGRDVRV